MHLPKVLIIGQPFDKNTGGGITLSNLFQGWGSDKLAVACTGYLLSPNIDFSICNNYYQLGDEEFKLLFPFNRLKRKYNSGRLKFEEKQVSNLKIKKSETKEKILAQFFFPFLEYTGLTHSISRVELTDKFCSWVREFNPDVIYAQAATRSNLLFCSLVASHFNKPFIFHMMDDWPSTIVGNGPFEKYWSKKIDNELRILLDKADVLVSISTFMSEEYKIRYGKEFIVFHNPIDIKFWGRYQKKDYKLSDCPKILYAGRTGLGIEDSLEVIAKSIQKLNEDLLLSIKFVLSIQQIPPWVKNYSCIELKSYTSYDLVPKTFSEADFLILPYDFSAKSIKYIQYSMPTKGPEYMISGTPIILFAPQATGIVKYFQQNKCAKVVTDNNINSLSNSIKELIYNDSERQDIAQNAIKSASEKFNSVKIIEDFRKMIISCTKNFRSNNV
ncbi:MAG: hypothetical protein ABI208_03355 [Ginsengibacter sp.]